MCFFHRLTQYTGNATVQRVAYTQEIAYSRRTLQGTSLKKGGCPAVVADVRFRQSSRGLVESGSRSSGSELRSLALDRRHSVHAGDAAGAGARPAGAKGYINARLLSLTARYLKNQPGNLKSPHSCNTRRDTYTGTNKLHHRITMSDENKQGGKPSPAVAHNNP